MNKPWLLSILVVLMFLEACGNTIQSVSPSTRQPTEIRLVPMSTTFAPTTAPTPKPTFSPISPTITSTSKTEVRLIKLHEWNISGWATWFTDNSRFAILFGDNDGQSIKIYLTDSLAELLKIPLPEKKLFTGIAVDPTNREIVLYGEDSLSVFETATGAFITQKPAKGNCFPVSFTDGMLFNDIQHLVVGFSGSQAKERRPISVVEWDTSTFTCLGEKITQPVGNGWPGGLYALNVSPNYANLVLIASSNHSESSLISIWDAKTLTQKCMIHGVYGDFKSFDYLLGVVDSQSAVLTYWDVDQCVPVRKINLPQYEYHQEIAFTADGKYLITRRDRYQVWDADTGVLIYESELLPEYGVNFGGSLKVSPSVSPDEQYLLSTQNGRDGNAVILWKITQR